MHTGPLRYRLTAFTRKTSQSLTVLDARVASRFTEVVSVASIAVCTRTSICLPNQPYLVSRINEADVLRYSAERMRSDVVSRARM